MVVGEVALVGLYGPATIFQSCHGSLNKGDAVTLEKVLEGNTQVTTVHAAGRYPDGTRDIMKVAARRNQRDRISHLLATQFSNGGERPETGAKYHDLRHGKSLFIFHNIYV